MKYKLNNLEVTDVEVDGVDQKDYPDFVMAFIESAKFVSSGKELKEDELEKLQEENADLFFEDIMEQIYDSVDMYC
jgi:hypothetical protein